MELCTQLINQSTDFIMHRHAFFMNPALYAYGLFYFSNYAVFVHEKHKSRRGCGYENQQLVGKVPWNNGKHMHTRKQSLLQSVRIQGLDLVLKHRHHAQILAWILDERVHSH